MSLFNTRQGPRSDAKVVAKSAAARMQRLKAIRKNMGDAKLSPRARDADEAEAAGFDAAAAPLTSPRRADGTEASWDGLNAPSDAPPEAPLVLSGAEMVSAGEPVPAAGPESAETGDDGSEALAASGDPVEEATEIEDDFTVAALADDYSDFDDDYEDEADALGEPGAAEAAFVASGETDGQEDTAELPPEMEPEAEPDAEPDVEPAGAAEDSPAAEAAEEAEAEPVTDLQGEAADEAQAEERHALAAEPVVEETDDEAPKDLAAAPEEVEDHGAAVDTDVLARLQAHFVSVRRPAAGPGAAEPEPAPAEASEQDDELPPPPPMPAFGRGRRGRNTTRLLGFDNAAGSKADLFDAPQDETPARQETEDGGAVSRFPVGWLVVIEGPGLGHAFTLGGGLSQIGRGEGQRIRLDFGDTAISRENHAAVAYDDEDHSLTIAQGGKANLVRLNGKPLLSNETLEDGDIIKIGATRLRVVQLCNRAFNWEGASEGNGA